MIFIYICYNSIKTSCWKSSPYFPLLTSPSKSSPYLVHQFLITLQLSSLGLVHVYFSHYRLL